MSQNQPASPALGGQNNPSAAGLLPLLTCVSSAANNQKVQGLALFLTTQATEVRHITNWFEITQQDPAHVNLSNKGILLTQGACCTWPAETHLLAASCWKAQLQLVSEHLGKRLHTPGSNKSNQLPRGSWHWELLSQAAAPASFSVQCIWKGEKKTEFWAEVNLKQIRQLFILTRTGQRVNPRSNPCSQISVLHHCQTGLLWLC